jgi:DNA topoisomerase I
MAQHWIRRLGTARSGFRYQHPDGRPVRDARTRQRIERLRVPPAWRDVHIAASASAAVQAWGMDVAGRRQYRYHDRAIQRGALRKYHRVRALAHSLPLVRRRLRQDAALPGASRDTVAAIAVRLIGETFGRVGGERSARHSGTFGLTTLAKAHVSTRRGLVQLEYVGKGRVGQRQYSAHPELVTLIRRLQRTPGDRLFRYRDQRGWHDLTAADVNRYVKQRLGNWTAKDFRTWGGTLRAATVLAELGPARSPTEARRNVALCMRLVSAELGNTPAICRASYVHPIVLARYLDEGDTIRLPARRRRRAPGASTHAPEERALIAFLDVHFPERRRQPRTGP